MKKAAIVSVADPDRSNYLSRTGEAIARQTVSCVHYIIALRNTPDVAAGAQTIIVRLPLGASHSLLARSIGMQLAFNENADVVASVVAGDVPDPRCLEVVTAALARTGADILELKHSEQAPGDVGTLFLSKHAAFVPAICAQLLPQDELSFRQIFDHIVSLHGLRHVVLESVLITNRVRGTAKNAKPPSSVAFVGEQCARELYQRTGVLFGSVKRTPARKVDTVAVITPYYKESLSMLRRCHESVILQGPNVKHFMVADGFPQPEIDQWNATHIALPLAHGDNGNTPRGIGGIVAFAQRYDAVTYLDADNWYAEGHMKSMLKAQRRSGASVVCSWRVVVLPDGTQLDRIDPEDRRKTHVDTSCFLITREVAFLAAFWAQMPQKLGPICDRVFLGRAIEADPNICWTERQTVYFESNYGLHYKMAKKLPDKPVRDIPSNFWKQIDPVEFRARTGRTMVVRKLIKKRRASLDHSFAKDRL